jgi:hypothetical protein
MQRKPLLAHFIVVIFCCLSVNICLANNTEIALPLAEEEGLTMQPKMDDMPPVSAPAPIETADDDPKSTEQYLYESNLKLSVVKYDLLKNNWALKFPRQALKDKKVFNKEESEILTLTAQTLISLNAPLNEFDFPEMYDLWASIADLMDESESAGLYTPSKDLQNALGAWRMKKSIDKATLEAAWILGPSLVEIDANVAPITIPAGFKFLPKEQLDILQNQLYEIKRTAIAQNKLKFPLAVPDKAISSLISLVDEKMSPKWTASITVLNNRFVDFDGKFINDEMHNSAELIQTIKNRLDPISNMRLNPSDMGSYNKNLVRWLVVPKRDLTNDSMQYAITDGAATEALGIEYAFLKLGKNQQVAVTINHLSVAQSLARSEYLPEGRKQADYLPENVLNPVLASIKPILQSISFKAGFQLKDATAADKKLQVTLASLIEGQPTIMEQGIKRIMAEDARKSNFWLFLKDHPRYQGMLFSALGLFLLAFSKIYNAKTPKSFSVNYPLFSSAIVLLLPLIMIGSIVYINFFAE